MPVPGQPPATCSPREPGPRGSKPQQVNTNGGGSADRESLIIEYRYLDTLTLLSVIVNSHEDTSRTVSTLGDIIFATSSLQASCPNVKTAESNYRSALHVHPSFIRSSPPSLATLSPRKKAWKGSLNTRF